MPLYRWGMFKWLVENVAGERTDASHDFESQEDAETWMGSEWARLAEAGGHAVILMNEEDVVYRMSLAPE